VEEWGGVFLRGVFFGPRPLCFLEVDAGMKDRRENTLFFWAHNSISG
jgi:hypothetical protein